MPTHRHELAVMFLAVLLSAWALRRRGRVTGSETKIMVGPRRGRKPDVSVFLPPDLPEPEDSLVRIAPYLVAEVVSPRPRDARRDRIDKQRDYASIGVRHYWIVDPHVRTFEALELDRKRGRYVASASFDSGRSRPVPGFAGLRIDLDGLWAYADGKDVHRKRAR